MEREYVSWMQLLIRQKAFKHPNNGMNLFSLLLLESVIKKSETKLSDQSSYKVTDALLIFYFTRPVV